MKKKAGTTSQSTTPPSAKLALMISTDGLAKRYWLLLSDCTLWFSFFSSSFSIYSSSHIYQRATGDSPIRNQGTLSTFGPLRKNLTLFIFESRFNLFHEEITCAWIVSLFCTKYFPSKLASKKNGKQNNNENNENNNNNKNKNDKSKKERKKNKFETHKCCCIDRQYRTDPIRCGNNKVLLAERLPLIYIGIRKYLAAFLMHATV